jgi:hypothetical protein
MVGEKHPYALALALLGLRTYNNSEAETLVQKWLSVSEVTQLLNATGASVKTVWSAALLDEIREWLKKLPTDLTSETASS